MNEIFVFLDKDILEHGSDQKLEFAEIALVLQCKKDLNTKKAPQYTEVCPESLGAILEYCYIERVTWLLCMASNNLASMVGLAYSYLQSH